MAKMFNDTAAADPQSLGHVGSLFCERSLSPDVPLAVFVARERMRRRQRQGWLRHVHPRC